MAESRAVARMGLDQQFEALAREMANAWRSAPPPDGILLPEVTRAGLAAVSAVGVIHGWTARVVRSGEAALLLEHQGYGEEASPLLRSMLEHTIALRWLVEHRGDAYQALVRQRAHQMTKLEEAQTTGWEIGGEDARQLLRQAIAAETDASTRPLDRLHSVKAQALEFGLGMLLQAWMIESGTSHASIASAAPYCARESSEGGEPTELELLLTPREGQREIFAAVASAIHTAIVFYNEVLPGRPLTAQLASWHARFEELGELLKERARAQTRGEVDAQPELG